MDPASVEVLAASQEVDMQDENQRMFLAGVLHEMKH